MELQSEIIHFHSRKCIWRCRLRMAAMLSRTQCVNLSPKTKSSGLKPHSYHDRRQFCRSVLRGPAGCRYDAISEDKGVISFIIIVVLYLIQMSSNLISWWRHQMESFSALRAICAGNSLVTGEFPAQRPGTRSFDAIFDLRLNKQLSKQLWSWWFETPSCSLWRHCDVLTITESCASPDFNDTLQWFYKVTKAIRSPVC